MTSLAWQRSCVFLRQGRHARQCGCTIARGHRRIVKITPAWRVYLLGATLCLALMICSRNFSDRGGPYFMASLTIAGLAYLLAIREFFATPKFSRRVLVIGLLL